MQICCLCHARVGHNKRADELTSIAPVAGTFVMDKGDIVKTIYKCPLVDDTRTRETAGSRMVESRVSVVPEECALEGMNATHLFTTG